MAPLSTIPMCTSLQFGVNGATKKMIEGYNLRTSSERSSRMTTSQYVLSGSIAGVANATLQTPIEHIRMIMQNQRNTSGRQGRYTGCYHALSSIYGKYGISKIYKGFSLTISRNILGFGAFFGFYDTGKDKIIQRYGYLGLHHSFMLGGMGGMLLWMSCYPIDVCKTKLQLDSLKNPKFEGPSDVFVKVFKKEGIKGFSKGFIPCIARAPFVNGAILLSYELLMNQF